MGEVQVGVGTESSEGEVGPVDSFCPVGHVSEAVGSVACGHELRQSPCMHTLSNAPPVFETGKSTLPAKTTLYQFDEERPNMRDMPPDNRVLTNEGKGENIGKWGKFVRGVGRWVLPHVLPISGSFENECGCHCRKIEWGRI